jgi:hypothetical protein
MWVRGPSSRPTGDSRTATMVRTAPSWLPTTPHTLPKSPRWPPVASWHHPEQGSILSALVYADGNAVRRTVRSLDTVTVAKVVARAVEEAFRIHGASQKAQLLGSRWVQLSCRVNAQADPSSAAERSGNRTGGAVVIAHASAPRDRGSCSQGIYGPAVGEVSGTVRGTSAPIEGSLVGLVAFPLASDARPSEEQYNQATHSGHYSQPFSSQPTGTYNSWGELLEQPCRSTRPSQRPHRRSREDGSSLDMRLG